MLRWEEPQADKLDLLEHFDTHAHLRNVLREIAAERGHWSGIPMPLEGARLRIEPTFPNAKELSDIGPEPDPVPEGYKTRNTFWSTKHRSTVVIFEKGRKVDWGIIPGIHHITMDIQTLFCSDAWGIEQEGAAVRLLSSMTTHRQFKQYMLTGMFLEQSKRSKLTYVFRRLKPTVVLDARSESKEKSTKILCCLCMHPIAFYDGSWAGAMCPTDDVIAHLALMRGDEPMYWRRAYQHAPHRPEAGL